MPTREQLDTAFATLERFAVAGDRAPMADTHGITSTLTTALCREGRIRSEVYALNWRVIEIMVGPNAGKRTAECPTKGAKPYLTVGRETVHHNRRRDYGSHSRPQPSAPRALSPQDLKD